MQKYGEVCESSIGFRVFTDHQSKLASENGNTFSVNKAMTQLVQTVQPMLEGLEGACRALFAGGERPDYGPAVLRSAFLLLKVK